MPTSNRARFTWQPGEIKTEDDPEPGDQKMLPGWFPGDFKTDSALLDAFEDAADWHAAGRGHKPGKAAVKAKVRAHLDRAAAGRPERGSAHAGTWDGVGGLIELAAAPPPQQGQQQGGGGGTLPPRVPAGSSAGGQFGAAQGSQVPKPAPKPPVKGKAPPPKGKAKPPAKPAAKGKPPAKLTGVAAQKASLLATAKSDKAQAQGLIKKIIAAQAQIKALQASGAKSTAANKAATASAGKTASTSNVTATSAPAAASTTAASPTAAASPAKASTPAPTAASLTKQVTAWQGQVKTLMSAAAQATAKAGKL